MAEHTKTYQRQRFRSRLAFVAVIGGTFVVAFLAGIGRITTLTAFLAIGLGASLSAIGWLVYGAYFDWRVRRHCRRAVDEMYHGAAKVPFIIELRQEGLWAHSRDTEVQFAWNRLTEIQDRGDGVELWFDPGLVLVRNRAFATLDDRRQFVEAARALASNTSAA
jgi:hypothetical protein